MPETKILKMGFEIEGEFSSSLMSKLQSVGRMKGDGSVRYCESAEARASHSDQISLQTAEFNSQVYTVGRVGMTNVKKFFNELQLAYKKKEFHFNKSCGFHIHLSFAPQYPPELISKQFVNHFKKALMNKQKKVMELRGHNNYCKTTIRERELTERYHGERYRFVNIWPALSRHGTIEFRIFPSTEPKTMYRYIVFTIGQVNEFLKKPIRIKARAYFDQKIVPKILEYNYAIPKVEVIEDNFEVNVQDILVNY